MKRDRTYRRRNRLVHLEELSDLLALHASEQKPASEALPGVQPLSVQELDAVAPEVSLPQVRAFEESGWAFVPRSASQSLPDGAVQAKVFVQPGGRLALGSDKLTLKLRQDASEQQANEILRPYGCRVVERLTFAPGLFRAAVTDQASGDAIDAANALMESGLVDFAELELIEMTGPREMAR